MVSICSPALVRFASTTLAGLWPLHRPSLLLLRCHFSCPHHPLERLCGTDLLLGLKFKCYFLGNVLPWVWSLLCVSEHKAHTPAFLIAALEARKVDWSACHLHNIRLCILYLE